MSKLCIVVEFDVKPDKADAFAAMFTAEFEPRSRAEAGCELYELWRSAETPARMTVVEKWTTKAHHDAHLAADWFKTWSPRMEAAQATPLVIRWMTEA